MKSGSKKLGSVSDLMSGLMMVFLFIAIAYMVQTEDSKIELILKSESAEDQEELALSLKDEAEEQRKSANALRVEAEEQRKNADDLRSEAERQRRNADNLRVTAELQRKEALTQKELVQQLYVKSELRSKAIREITATFEGLQKSLYETLADEFRDDLPRWNATLEKDSTIRFNEPDVLFKTGEAELQKKFIVILNDFFPRYERILSSQKFKNEIDEIRVEGHTSSEWNGAIQRKDRFIKNVELSQERTLSVLKYSISLIDQLDKEVWLSQKIRANGLGFAKLIRDENGIEDKELSRRVEFRVITKTRDKIVKIIEEINEDDYRF